MESSNSSKLIIVVALLVGVLSMKYANAQTICKVPLSGLNACRPAATPPRPPPPTSACCQAVAIADFNCLCNYKGLLPSLGIDQNLVFQLPKKCKLNKSFNC